MANKYIGIIGAAVLAIGVIGLAVTVFFGNTALLPGPLYGEEYVDSFTGSLGEQIYYTGVGTDGAIPRSGGMRHMGSGGCVTCHGRDGLGGQVGMMAWSEDAPPITYEALTGEHDAHGDEPDEEWSDSDIARAVRDGELPDGDQLDPIMPRWDMTDREMDALIDYLKTLDGSERP